MKRLTLFMTVLIIIFISGVSGAESILDWFNLTTATPVITETPIPSATPAPDDFRFRNGIRWGMTTQQVRAMEDVKMTERSMQSWSVMLTDEKVSVSRFSAQLVFMFREDRLLMITYEFQQQNSQDDFLYLTGALSSLYGESLQADPLKVKALMDLINPNYYKLEKIRDALAWTAPDGTVIYQYHYSDNAYAIMYVCPQLSTRIYQTNGL